jgi:LacI family transcriptional regulator
MATLRSIAEDLDISVSLVSKVLNGRLGTTGASPETVSLIQDAARRLNYKKNFSAESLATGKQRAIGVFMHRHGAPGSAVAEATIIGAANKAAEAGQRLVLRFFEAPQEFYDACTEMHCNALDGLILAGVLHEELVTQLAKMRAARIPVVTIHDRQTNERVPNVGCDPVRVGELGTQHLIERGCKRIVHIKAQELRAVGYKQALKQAGLPFSSEMVYEAPNYLASSGEAAVRHFLKQGIEFDGIVAQSDHLVAGAMKVLLAAGKRIPQDVKLIGVDNAPFCELFPITISSISEEDQHRGEAAVELLLSMINGQPAQTRQVEPVVVPRESSAAA